MSNLEDRIVELLGLRSKKNINRDFFEKYHDQFEQSGKNKAQEVLKHVREIIGNKPLDRFGYLSIGGSTGAEVEYILNNSEIKYGLLLEHNSGATKIASGRLSHLESLGKHLEIKTGDAMGLIKECRVFLEKWRLAGKIDGLIVSAQAVLHELPFRSKGFKMFPFLGDVVWEWDPCIFVSREPCSPQSWPANVALSIPGVSSEILERLANDIRAYLRMESDVDTVGPDFVLMSKDLAVETITKIFYMEEYAHEIQEQVTSINADSIRSTLEKLLGRNSVKIIRTVSKSFASRYVELGVDVRTEGLTDDLSIPESFSWIIGERITREKLPPPPPTENKQPGPLPAHILYPQVDVSGLKTDVGCRWGLWRAGLLGFLLGPNGEENLQILNGVERQLEQAMSQKPSPQLPLRQWHLLDSTHRPPQSTEAVNTLLGSSKKGEIIGGASLLGIIITFLEPLNVSPLARNPLAKRFKEWLSPLFQWIPAEKKVAIICLVQGGSADKLKKTIHDMKLSQPWNVPVEFLKTCSLSQGHDPVHDLWRSPDSSVDLSTDSQVLDRFKQLIIEDVSHNMTSQFPSGEKLLKSLEGIQDKNEKCTRFWQLLTAVEKYRPRLLGSLVSLAAWSSDSIISEIALRFSKRDDYLMDSWLNTRIGEASIMPSLNLGADPRYGGAYVNELALGLARQVWESGVGHAEIVTWIESLKDDVPREWSWILDAAISRTVPQDILENTDSSIILVAHRSGCLNHLDPESFPSNLKNPYLYWLALTKPPTQEWIAKLLTLPMSARAVFGLISHDEHDELIKESDLYRQVEQCRRGLTSSQDSTQ